MPIKMSITTMCDSILSDLSPIAAMEDQSHGNPTSCEPQEPRVRRGGREKGDLSEAKLLPALVEKSDQGGGPKPAPWGEGEPILSNHPQVRGGPQEGVSACKGEEKGTRKPFTPTKAGRIWRRRVIKEGEGRNHDQWLQLSENQQEA